MDLCQRRLEASFEALGIDSTDLALRPRVYGDNIPRNLMKNYSDSLFRRVDVFYTESKIPLNLQLPTPEMNKKKLNAFVSNSNEEEMMLEFGILFHPGLDLILPESFRELKDLALFLNKHQNLKLHIRGHVCCGPHLALSNQRARKVSDYLTIHGIKKDRITAKGYSNTLPAVTPELTEAQARRNRRVDIIFTKMK